MGWMSPGAPPLLYANIGWMSLEDGALSRGRAVRDRSGAAAVALPAAGREPARHAGCWLRAWR